MEEFIKQIEKSYLAKTYDYVQDVFTGHHLPSHDHTHHFRVWQYAKEYLIQNKGTDKPLEHKEILSVFLSCFFHDTGMSVTLDKLHGSASKIIFDKFVNGHLNAEIFNFEETCLAIEKHDNKEAISFGIPGFSDNSNTQSILSVCDDLDAFGAIGILRYTEIYLLRKIPLQEISEAISDNLNYRFKNFVKSAEHLPEFFSRHSRRAEYTIDFFQNGINKRSWQYEYLETIQKYVIGNKMNYQQFLENIKINCQHDEFISLLHHDLDFKFDV